MATKGDNKQIENQKERNREISAHQIGGVRETEKQKLVTDKW